MDKQSSNNFELFLEPTEFCDFLHTDIQKIANDYLKNYSDQKERAIALFEFVRDTVHYKIGPWDKKASETLQEKRGMCTNSTNLLVALLRASRVPAGYCIYRVIGVESFGHILPKIIRNKIDKDSVHIVTYVFLGKWIKCDASTDSELSGKSKHLSKMSELIVWDGVNDAVHPMEQGNILSVTKPLHNIDFQLVKKPRFVVRYHIFAVGNLFIDYLLERGHEFRTIEQLEKGFALWLRKNHFWTFLINKAVTFFQVLKEQK